MKAVWPRERVLCHVPACVTNLPVVRRIPWPDGGEDHPQGQLVPAHSSIGAAPETKPALVRLKDPDFSQGKECFR
jgi:hypothetical protein